MRKKLRARAGFTLTEALVALAVVGLIALAVAVGVPTALRVQREATASAEAGVLCSTLATAVSDELRFCTAPAEDGSFDSAVYGRDAAFVLDGGRACVQSGGTRYPLLAETAYTGTLRLGTLAVAYTDGLFSVTIAVTDADGAELARAAFTLRALNG